jgi:hypothetical protein
VKGRPVQAAQDDADDVTDSIASLDDSGASALRCWANRDRHGCGCLYPDDCVLNGPLPVHDDQPCPGMRGNGGTWQPHCRDAA